MDWVSSAGHYKALPADMQIIKNNGTHPVERICAKVTTSAAYSRTANQTGWMTWDTSLSDGYNFFRPGTSATRLYVPQSGWYYCNVYCSSITATAHEASLQIHSSRLNSFFAYNKKKFGAGSASYPNMMSASGLVYLYAGDSIYANWGTSAAITSLTGVASVGFGIWKVDR
jgi:hypothetical protein